MALIDFLSAVLVEATYWIEIGIVLLQKVSSSQWKENFIFQ